MNQIKNLVKIGKVIKNIPKNTYKRDVVYVKQPSKNQVRNQKYIKNKFLIFIKIGVLNL